LVRSVHRYNAELDASETKEGVTMSESKRILMYPGTTITIIAAVVTIQTVWRSYSSRKRVMNPSPLGTQIAHRRAKCCLVRWWKNKLLSYRLYMLTGLRRYGSSINSRHLFMRGDAYDLVMRIPPAFITAGLFPEHRVSWLSFILCL
jgi:hypothetical protein